MSHPIRAIAIVCSVAVLAACGDDRGSSPSAGLDGEVVVFAAASLTDAFEELADAFEAANSGVEVTFNFAGSSALREQILAGAPADVFASANPSNMDQVVDAGGAEAPVDLVLNRLEIAVPAGNEAAVTGLADFADASLLIGLCAEAVPCGELGRVVLSNAGVTPSVDTDEPDVRSLLTKIEAGELDAGIVYRTDVLAAGDSVEGIEIAEDVNVVATYPIAALTEARDAELAEAFVRFALSDEGRAILTSYGFDVP